MKKLILYGVALTMLFSRLVSGQSGAGSEINLVSIRPATHSPEGTVHIPSLNNEPGRSLNFSNVSLRTLLSLAFGVGAMQIAGPEWLSQGRFDVTASIPPNTPDERTNVALQSLLTETFGLSFHHEQDIMWVFALEQGDGGIILQATPTNESDEPGCTESIKHPVTILRAVCHRLSSADIALQLQTMALSDLGGRPVIDMTGLPGRYDFGLEWIARGHAGDDVSIPPIFDAVRQQLGLRVVPRKRIVDVMVIDHFDLKRP